MNVRKWMVAAVCALVWGPAVGDMVAVSKQEQAALGIEVAAAMPSVEADTVALTLRVAFSPDAEWVIKSPLPGMLYRSMVQQGDRVQAGDPLAVIRSAAFVDLQRDYLEARAELQLAEAAWRRDARLYEAGSIADRRWQETEYRYRAAVATHAALVGQLALAGMDDRDLDRLASDAAISAELVLRAPADTIVLERPAALGSQLDGTEVLLRLGEPDKLVLNGMVARALAERLYVGAPLGLEGGGTRAVITFVSTVLDTDSQTVDVRAAPESTEGLAAGQLSQWRVLSVEPVLLLPSGAVVRLDDRDVVYVAVAGGFETREVAVSSTAAGEWVVLDGLEHGERVAVRGTAVLKGASLGLGTSDNG